MMYRKKAPVVTKEKEEKEPLESMKKLQQLKEKIVREWEKEKQEQERQESEAKETLLPLSLMGETTRPTRKGKRAQERPQGLTRDAREKISKLDLKDKAVTRELEHELEKKSQEMTELRQQNHMYRDIITLRQESNARREKALEKEVDKIKVLTDTVCVRTNNLDQTMGTLRQMNRDIQDGAAQLKTTIEQQAEADLLGLIRTYRVRMRELKQQIGDQKAVNYEGAKAWIDRHEVLLQDKNTAIANLEALDAHNAMLETQNEELKVMAKHQAEQRNTLTAKIAVVKRENKRLEDQTQRLEQQLTVARPTTSAQGTPARAFRSASRVSTAPQGASRPARDHPRSAVPSVFVDKRQSAALAKVKKQLEEMRHALKQVRGAHIELLQERTELEVFMRQCIEDVRRDMYRFTVVSTIPRGTSVDAAEERNVLQEYGANEKKILIDILNSKLKVMTLLHNKMFPQKIPLSSDVLGDFMDEAAMNAGAAKNVPRDGPGASGDRREVLSSAIGTVPGGATSVAGAGMTSDSVAEMTMDKLWDRWKDWSTSYHS